MVWYSHLIKNFVYLVLIHTVEGFSVVIEAKIDIFLEFLCFLYDPTNVGDLISGSIAFSNPSVYIWKFSVHVLLKPNLKNFDHYFVSIFLLAFSYNLHYFITIYIIVAKYPLKGLCHDLFSSLCLWI